MTTKVGTLDKVGKIFKREFALNNFTDVLFFDKFHIAVGFGPSYFSLGEAAGTFKNKFYTVLGSDRFDFNFVGDTREVANDFLEVGGRKVKNGREFDIGNGEFVRVGFD